MGNLLSQICRIRLEDVPSMIKLTLTFVPAKVYKHFYPDIWTVTEYPENARDNGYWLFKYIRENYPEKKVFYPIKKQSSDYSKVKDLGNTVEFGGWKHYFLFWASNKFIGTTKYHGFPDERITSGLFELKLHRFKYVFLNHGFARGFSNIVNAKKTNYDLVIAMSELEKEIITNLNFQPAERVKAIGFCRHDNLDNTMLDPHMIVIMPTWRRWLDYRHEKDMNKIESIKEKFFASSYFKEYSNLINDPDFLQFLESNDLKVIFYLHGYAQIYKECFKSLSNRVIIAGKDEYFVQDLLKQAAFLVTDYSSVVFDYSYMKKPMVYFQFDAEEFSEKQYSESEYYTYREKGFGPIVYTYQDVIREIKKSYKNHFAIEDEYLDRVEDFFVNFDKNHCEKTYQLIDQL